MDLFFVEQCQIEPAGRSLRTPRSMDAASFIIRYRTSSLLRKEDLSACSVTQPFQCNTGLLVAQNLAGWGTSKTKDEHASPVTKPGIVL